MRPYELRHTDAIQNMTEALTAVQVVQPGVYVAMHNRVLQFPGWSKTVSWEPSLRVNRPVLR